MNECTMILFCHEITFQAICLVKIASDTYPLIADKHVLLLVVRSQMGDHAGGGLLGELVRLKRRLYGTCSILTRSLYQEDFLHESLHSFSFIPPIDLIVWLIFC